MEGVKSPDPRESPFTSRLKYIQDVRSRPGKLSRDTIRKSPLPRVQNDSRPHGRTHTHIYTRAHTFQRNLLHRKLVFAEPTFHIVRTFSLTRRLTHPQTTSTRKIGRCSGTRARRGGRLMDGRVPHSRPTRGPRRWTWHVTVVAQHRTRGGTGGQTNSPEPDRGRRETPRVTRDRDTRITDRVSPGSQIPCPTHLLLQPGRPRRTNGSDTHTPKNKYEDDHTCLFTRVCVCLYVPTGGPGCR